MAATTHTQHTHVRITAPRMKTQCCKKARMPAAAAQLLTQQRGKFHWEHTFVRIHGCDRAYCPGSVDPFAAVASAFCWTWVRHGIRGFSRPPRCAANSMTYCQTWHQYRLAESLTHSVALVLRDDSTHDARFVSTKHLPQAVVSQYQASTLHVGPPRTTCTKL